MGRVATSKRSRRQGCRSMPPPRWRRRSITRRTCCRRRRPSRRSSTTTRCTRTRTGRTPWSRRPRRPTPWSRACRSTRRSPRRTRRTERSATSAKTSIGPPTRADGSAIRMSARRFSSRFGSRLRQVDEDDDAFSDEVGGAAGRDAARLRSASAAERALDAARGQLAGGLAEHELWRACVDAVGRCEPRSELVVGTTPESFAASLGARSHRDSRAP